MTTPKKAAANRRNAARSTGPKSRQGKARSARNALSHGLRSAFVVAPFESGAEWEAHRAAVFADLAPVGYLEESLSHRIAEGLWRLRRVSRAEAATAEDGETFARKLHLKGASPEDARLDLEMHAEDASALWGLDPSSSFASEDSWKVEPEKADRIAGTLFHAEDAEEAFGPPPAGGWTVGTIREAVDALAREGGKTFAGLVREKSEDAEKSCAALVKGLAEYRSMAAGLHVPKDWEQVARYEAGLERSLFRNVHELERLQARRAGAHVPPPAVADVTVSRDEA